MASPLLEGDAPVAPVPAAVDGATNACRRRRRRRKLSRLSELVQPRIRRAEGWASHTGDAGSPPQNRPRPALLRVSGAPAPRDA